MITELVIGYLYPGKPLANVSFKTYGYISMASALSFVQDFKLGHYLKIPPKSMFAAQVISTPLDNNCVRLGNTRKLLFDSLHLIGNLPLLRDQFD